MSFEEYAKRSGKSKKSILKSPDKDGSTDSSPVGRRKRETVASVKANIALRDSRTRSVDKGPKGVKIPNIGKDAPYAELSGSHLRY